MSGIDFQNLLFSCVFIANNQHGGAAPVCEVALLKSIGNGCLVRAFEREAWAPHSPGCRVMRSASNGARAFAVQYLLSACSRRVAAPHAHACQVLRGCRQALLRSQSAQADIRNSTPAAVAHQASRREPFRRGQTEARGGL